MPLPGTIWLDNGLSNVTRTLGQLVFTPLGNLVNVPLGNFSVAFDPSVNFTVWEDYTPDQ